VKTLWKAAIVPEDKSSKVGGFYVPRLSAIVGMAKLIKKIGLGGKFSRYYNEAKALGLISTEKLIDTTRILQTAGVVNIETPEIDIDINDYIRYQLDEAGNFIPDEIAGYDVPPLSELWKDIPELNIHYDPYKFVTDFDDPDLNEKDLFRQFGFASWMLIDIKDWLSDAGGYLAQPGQYGSELVDDILGIFCPTVGLLDMVLDIAGGIKKGMETYNKYAEAYNSARSSIISALALGSDNIAAFLSDWTDEEIIPEEITNEILEYLDDKMGDAIDIFQQTPVLPELQDWLIDLIPEIEFGLIDSEDPLSVFGDLAQLALWGPVGELIQYYMSYAKTNFQDAPEYIIPWSELEVDPELDDKPKMPPPINWK
jgi:hypothetical protein